MRIAARVRLYCAGTLGVFVGMAGGCAEELGLPGADDEALPLMRSLEAGEFAQSSSLTVDAAEGWLATGVFPPRGSPVRVWNEAEVRGDVTRQGGPLDATHPPGALLLRQGDRVFSADFGLAYYAASDEEIFLGINGGGATTVTIAWGTPERPHAPGVERLAVAASGTDVDMVMLDPAGGFVDVGDFEAGSRLRVVAERRPLDGEFPSHLDGGVGSEPGPDPGPMARLMPDEVQPNLRYPGLWDAGVAYRIDGVLAGHLPLGGVLHLPDGGELSLAANATIDASSVTGEGLLVALEPLPRLGVELSTLPWSAFTDGTAAVQTGPRTGWAPTGLTVEAGNVVRVTAIGALREVGGPGAPDVVGPAGLWMRAGTDDWLVPGSRVLAPHVRIGGHVVAVPADGVFTAPTSGAVEVAANGCAAGEPGSCADALAGATGTFEVAVGVVRSHPASEVD